MFALLFRSLPPSFISLVCRTHAASGNESSNNENAPLAKVEDLGEESLTSVTSAAAGREKHEAENGGGKGGGGGKEGVVEEAVKELTVSYGKNV